MCQIKNKYCDLFLRGSNKHAMQKRLIISLGIYNVFWRKTFRAQRPKKKNLLSLTGSQNLYDMENFSKPSMTYDMNKRMCVTSKY